MSNYNRNYNHSHNHNENYEERESESFEYTQDDLDSMYRDAFEGDPEAYWNID